MNNVSKEYSKNLEDFHKKPLPQLSFEFFPPKTDVLENELWQEIQYLEKLNPKFVSITYGAGGSTKDRTRNIIQKILSESKVMAAAHLTCVGSSRAEIHKIIEDYWDIGVRHIVALRGDIKASSPLHTIVQDGYKYADELTKAIKNIANFEVSVAGYPEKHPEARSLDEDIDNLKRKVDNGADRIITQFFFDTDCYLRFVEKCRKAGIEIPIIPGILPINNYEKVAEFSKKCGSTMPVWIAKLFAENETLEAKDDIAITIAVQQIALLRKYDVDHFHFYTLNKAFLTHSICRELGII